LKTQKRVFGSLPSLDALVNPIEEQDMFKDSPYAFPGGDHEIVGQVQHEIQVQKGEVIEVDEEDSDEEDDPEANVRRRDTIASGKPYIYFSVLFSAFLCFFVKK
jgi:hypothetical protein